MNSGVKQLMRMGRAVIRRGVAPAAVLLLAASSPANYPVPVLPVVLYTDAPRPEMLKVADFDGDGRPDIVTFTVREQFEDPHLLKVYPQADQPGRFDAPTTYELPYRPRTFAVGDVNGDAIVDVVIADFGRATILYRDAQGDFADTRELDLPEKTVLRVHLADMDGDGALDVVALMDSSGLQVVYQAPPLGLPGTEFTRIAAIDAFTHDFVATDFDADGDLDLAYPCFGMDAGCTLGIVLQQPDGTFAPAALKGPSGHYTLALQLADLNGDSRLDAVVVGDVNRTLGFLFQTETGDFEEVATYQQGGNETALAIGDLDLDGQPDIVAAMNGFSRIGVYLRDAEGGFLPARYYHVPVVRGGGADGFGYEALAIADVSSDGKPDIVLADAVEGQVVWFNSAGDVPTGDLSVAVVPDPDVREVLADRTFGVAVSNQGPYTMTDVVVYNFLPTLFDFVSGDPFCGAVDDVLVICAFGELAPGATASAEFVASARSSQAFLPSDNTNDALVDAREIDFFPDNNIESTRVTAENLHHAGSITFLQSAYTVLRGAGEIVIPVARIDGKVDGVTVGMQANGITAQGAVDYQGITSASLFWNHDDDAPQNLTFQILPAEPRPDRTFRITLTDLDPLASVGPIAETTVTIHDPAYVPPAPSSGSGGSMPGAGLLLLAMLGAGRGRPQRSMRGR